MTVGGGISALNTGTRAVRHALLSAPAHRLPVGAIAIAIRCHAAAPPMPNPMQAGETDAGLFMYLAWHNTHSPLECAATLALLHCIEPCLT